MTWVPKVNKMSFWARCDKNSQAILQSVSSKCLEQAQGGTDREYRSRKNTMTAVDIVSPWHLGPIQPSLTVGSSEEVGVEDKERMRWWRTDNTSSSSFCHGLGLGESVWMDLQEERENYVCVLSGTVECVTMRFTLSLLWWSVLMQVRKSLWDNLT